MEVTVFGVGYVGLVQAAVLAQVGHKVVCVDVDEAKVAQLNRGVVPIYEPDLPELVKSGLASGRLLFTTSAQVGVAHGEIQFIAVGTPPGEDGAADLQYVLEVARTIAKLMEGPKVVVDKSTVPVGTAARVKKEMVRILEERGQRFDLEVVSNPEFLKEGDAVSDCQKPDRIIVGTDSESVRVMMTRLYAPFNRNRNRILFMSVASAELTKYAANCMLATKISFMNEMANLAEKLGADIESVRLGIGSDSRIGFQYIYPGCGYGGSCFPKDVKALVETAHRVGYTPSLLEAVEQVNRVQKGKMFEYINGHFGGKMEGRVVAIWGLAFKARTDDMREAPSRVLMEQLWSAGARVRAYDPQAMDKARALYGERGDFLLCDDKETATEGADILAICTEWSQFRAPDFDLLAQKLGSKVIVDGRNMFDPIYLSDLGFTYYGIGRGDSIKSGEN